MKKYLYMGILLSASLHSCYDDKSTFPVNTIDDVVLTIADADRVIRTGYLDQLDIVPNLTKSGKALDDANFSYTWEMNVLPRNNEFEVLSTDRELHAVINQPISTDNYLLKLTVHDNVEDLNYLFTWNVYVETAFLDGLVVSDTHDGATSDLTLILNHKLTMNYTKSEAIHRNIVTAATGHPYPSLLSSLTPFLFGSIYGTHSNYLFATDSDRHLVRFNCQDFSMTNGKDLVYYYEGEHVNTLFSTGPNVANCNHYLFTNEGVYFCDQNSTNFVTTTNAILSVSAPKDNMIAYKTHDASVDYWDGGCAAAWIDDSNGNIVIMSSNFQGGSYSELEEGENPAFSVGDLGAQKVVAAGMTGGGITPTFLLKEADGNYGVYTVTTNITTYYDEEWDYSYDVTSYRPGRHIAVPDEVAALVDTAVATEFTDENSVLYIASPSEVSAVLYGAGTITAPSTKFTPDAGESITSIKVYRQGDYYYSSGLLLDSYADYNKPRLDLTSRALIVTTQNGNDGYVYVVPMTQLGTGNLDKNAAMKFGGFGRILDVATTGY